MRKIIFVTVGTGKFDDLVINLDKCAHELDSRIILQIGNGKYIPKNCSYFRFKKNLEPFYKKSWLIVAHGGAGTIYELLKKKKKLIGAANFDRTDRHQEEILKALSAENYLIWCKDVKKVLDQIKQARNFKFKRYVPPKCTIDKKISEFISKTVPHDS